VNSKIVKKKIHVNGQLIEIEYEHQRQNWEYKIVEMEGDRLDKLNLLIDGIPYDVNNVLIDLGESGWELISSTQKVDGKGYFLFFRREKFFKFTQNSR